MQRLISDEVWRQLDPWAGRLSRRTEVWIWLTAGLAVLVLAATTPIAQSGLIRPNLGWPANSGFDASVDVRHVTHSIQVENRGWTGVVLVGAGRSGPGLVLTHVTPAFPVTLPRAGVQEIVLEYDVTDCAAVTAEPWPVPVRVDRPWGVQTVYIDVPTQPSLTAPDSYFYQGQDPYAVQWQRALADAACATAS